MATNSENNTWNNLYLGSRVPVNDTGLDGAPFALFSTPSWENGCVNKSVVDTWQINGEIFAAEDIDSSEILDLGFEALSPYIFKDMLYGYNGEAYNQEPIGTMDYRGYPTPLQQTLTADVKYNFSSYSYLPDGDIVALERSVVLNLGLAFSYLLPYPVYGSLIVTNLNTLELTTYETKIDSGSFGVTHYRIPQPDPELEPNPWVGIINQEMYLSVSTVSLVDASLSIKVEYTHITDPINLGTAIDLTHVITLDDYSTDLTPGCTHLGEARKLTGITQAECFSETCNESDRTTLSTKTSGQLLFMSSSDTLVIGTKLYKEDLLTTAGSAGVYWWVDFAYTLDGIDVFTITQIVQLDANGLVISIEAPSGWMGANCWINSSCQ